jgi:hypothetical protein
MTRDVVWLALLAAALLVIAVVANVLWFGWLK